MNENVVEKKKRGRPAKVKDETTQVEPKKRGRPVKSAEEKAEQKIVKITERIENAKNGAGLRLVGQILNDVNDTEPVGYVVYLEKTNNAKFCNVAQTKGLLKRFPFINAVLKGDKITNTECAMNKLVKFDTSGNLLESKKLTILAEIRESYSDLVGYRVLDERCQKVKNFLEEDLITLVKERGYTLVNGKIVSRNDKLYVSGIKTDFVSIVKDKEEQDVEPTVFEENVKKKEEFANDRKNRHVSKLMSHLDTYFVGYAGNIKNLTSDKLLVATEVIKKYNSGVLRYYPFKELEIYIREIFSPLVESEEDKAILSRLYKQVKTGMKSQSHGVSNKEFYSFLEENRNLFDTIYQFGLFNDGFYKLAVESIKAQIKEADFYKVDGLKSRYNEETLKYDISVLEKDINEKTLSDNSKIFINEKLPFIQEWAKKGHSYAKDNVYSVEQILNLGIAEKDKSSKLKEFENAVLEMYKDKIMDYLKACKKNLNNFELIMIDAFLLLESDEGLALVAEMNK